MNKETCDPKVGNNAFVEGIYSIIRELLRPLIGENTMTDSKSNKEKTLQNLKTAEQWFLAFEKYSKIKKLLLLLKKHLLRNNENPEKAMLVLSLLADDQYIKLSQKDLEYRLGIIKRYQAA